MSPRHEEVFEFCAGYVLGSLPETDRRLLEQHLTEGCPECEAELKRLGIGTWLLAASTPQLRAPAGLRHRVLDAVRAEAIASGPSREADRAEPGRLSPVRRPARRGGSIARWAWAAAAVVIAVVGVMQWRANAVLERGLAAARGELERLRQELENERRWAALPDAPGAVVVRLEPTPDGSPDLSARATYDPTTRRAVVVFSQFTAPAGKDYQLWAITSAGPSSLGLVRADTSGRAVVRLPDVGDAAALAAFAVSLERVGGAPTPHAPAGPVVMVGKVGG